MRITSVGHAVFAATMVALGIVGLIHRDFAPIWQPVPKDVPARDVLVYLCALVPLASGVALLWRRASAAGAGALLALLAIWLLLFKAPIVFRAPAVAVSWESCAETVVIVAGAFALYARLGENAAKKPRLAFAGENGARIARALYGLALIPLGLAHFVYVEETAALVPGWLPAHASWAYFTGCAYIAAGVGILIDVYARLAATLAALQMGVFTLLVWAPIVAAGANAFQWSETVVSWTLTAAAWVVADSYRGTRWLAMNER